MALLQITEPDAPVTTRRLRLAAGIDLGTTNSLIATVRDGEAVCLPDENGDFILSSVVHYCQNGQVEVGGQALDVASEDPKNVLLSVKRFMGRGLADVVHIESLPYDFIESDGLVRFRTAQGVRTPIEVSAEILRVLARRAEKALGGDLEGVVITVPAYFDDAQRQATRDAATLAGLRVLRMLNEPTAAAIAYGLDNASEGVYAVYDLGGGTFDLSVLKLSRGIFEVLATSGNTALGGDDFDHRLYCWVLERSGQGLLSGSDARALLMKCREAKEALTQSESAPVMLDLHDGGRIAMEVTREDFFAITETLVGKTLTSIRKVLRDARLEPEDIKGVVMVGGATRMPHIQRAVAEFFGHEPLTNLDPDKVVAMGAAIQANVLAGNRAEGEDWLLLDVIPLSLGMETMGGMVEKIIPRNATLPIARAQEFTTFKDGQTAMGFHVVQGERELAQDCRSLARFELHRIPPMVAGAARIRVTFQVDADGLLSVSAEEETTGAKAAVTVKPSYGLSDGEIAGMLRASMEHAQEDMESRALRELQVEAQRLLLAVSQALAEDSDLLNADERAQIDGAMQDLQRTYQTVPRQEIQRYLDALIQVTDEFASRRMNKSVHQALAGKKVKEIQL